MFLVQAFVESGVILLKSNAEFVGWCRAKLRSVKQKFRCCRRPIELLFNSDSAKTAKACRQHVITHKRKILTNLAQESHNQWNTDYHLANDTTDSVAERFKEEKGDKFNIAVPFDELHHLWRNKQIVCQAEHLLQLRPIVDDTENVLSMPYEELVTLCASKIHDVWMVNESWRKDQGTDLHLFVPFNELDAIEQEKDSDMARMVMPILWSLDNKSDSLEKVKLVFSNRQSVDENGVDVAAETRELAQDVQVELAMTLKIYLMVMSFGMCTTELMSFGRLWHLGTLFPCSRCLSQLRSFSRCSLGLAVTSQHLNTWIQMD